MYERSAWPLWARFGGFSEISSDIRQQLAAARPAIIAGFLLAALLLGTVVVLHFWRGTSFTAFMQDPAAHVGAPAYVGAISHIGVMMWAGAAAICLFAAWTIWRADGDREDMRFLAWSGLGTLYLAIDDVMLLHEEIIVKLTGLPEELILGAYAAALALYFIRFYGALLRAEYALLLIAVFFGGLSVALDILLPFSDVQTFFEDGAKLIAIIFWLIFYARTSAAAVGRQAMTPSGRPSLSRVD